MLWILVNVNWVSIRHVIFNDRNWNESLLEPEFVVEMPPEEPEPDSYPDSKEPPQDPPNDVLNYRAKVVIIATGVLGALLIIVVAAILCN